MTVTLTLLDHFNPRSPWGERPGYNEIGAYTEIFQSTLPVRGATFVASVHFALREFQSTLPVRGATRRTRFLSNSE